MPSVTLAILNYNGKHHLEHLLPTAVAEASRYGPACEVAIVDNRSPGDDMRWVNENFPSVQVWTAPRNDYLFSYNLYARESQADILVFLNNDLKLCPNFVLPLVRHFTAGDVFSVGATSMDWDGLEYTCGPSQLTYKNGFYSWEYKYGSQECCHTLFTSGGFMAVDRKKFLELGGFDRLYYPAYVEDVDLCFRAWRRRWRCIFEPASKVLHREGGSWSKVSNSRMDTMLLRNSLLFQWTSLPMGRHRLKRWLSTTKICLAALANRDLSWLNNLISAWIFFVLSGRIFIKSQTSEADISRINHSIQD